MLIDQQARAGKANGIDERGVTEPIDDHRVAGPGQRLNHAQIGHIPARKKKRRFPMQKCGERIFKVPMDH